MFNGEEQLVQIRFINPLLDTVIDRFGTDGKVVQYVKDDERHFIMTAKLAVSDQFFGWLLGFGREAKIIGGDVVLLMMWAAGTAWISSNLVFTNSKGERLSYRTVYDCFKRVVKKMGASELRFHDLRHTYAVISIKNGDDIKTVQNNLGHATASFTLDVYGHVTEQMKRDSSSRMEHFIQGISELR